MADFELNKENLEEVSGGGNLTKEEEQAIRQWEKWHGHKINFDLCNSKRIGAGLPVLTQEYIDSLYRKRDGKA